MIARPDIQLVATTYELAFDRSTEIGALHEQAIAKYEQASKRITAAAYAGKATEDDVMELESLLGVVRKHKAAYDQTIADQKAAWNLLSKLFPKLKLWEAYADTNPTVIGVISV